MVVLDARKKTAETWPEGSFRADLERDLSAPGDFAVGGRHPLPSIESWATTLGTWGIRPDTDVIVTDDAHGGLAAARCWWMLRAVGHTRVVVVPLQELNLPMCSELAPLREDPPYPALGWAWPTVTATEVERYREDSDWRLLDARSAARYRGEFEPIDPIAGHIPGADSLPWEETTDLEVFRGRLAAVLGDTPQARVIVSCGSGVTACHTLLQMDRLGLQPAALYVGSWSEWCRQDASNDTSKSGSGSAPS